MIYLQVVIRTKRAKSDEFSAIFEKEVLPLWQKSGMHLAAAWKTTIGIYDEVTDLWEFESLAEMESIRNAQSKNPAVAEATAKVAHLIVYEESKVLVPLAYSPLR